jgi:hypothetical protein
LQGKTVGNEIRMREVIETVAFSFTTYELAYAEEMPCLYLNVVQELKE